MMAVKIFAASLATASVLIGFPLNGLILAYMEQKSSLHKTSLDLVIKDAIASAMALLLVNLCVYLLGTFFSPLPFWPNVVLSVFQVLTVYTFFVSAHTTLVVKYLFLNHSSILFEVSDDKVRQWSWLVKVILVTLWTCIDQVGFVTMDPLSFKFMNLGSEEDFSW